MQDENQRHRKRGRPRSAAGEEPAHVVQALDRGLSLLALLARKDDVTLTELALSAGIATATTHRMLMTLHARGMVTFDEDAQTWGIGAETFRIGSAFLRRTNYVEAGRKIMRTLMETTGETSNLGIEDHGEVVFLSQIETHMNIRAFFRPGTRARMHASGIGKILLAQMPRQAVFAIISEKPLTRMTAKTITTAEGLFHDLEQSRSRGWSVDDEEATLGMRCLAAPIFNEFGEAIAAISISGPAVRLSDEKIAEFGPLVREGAIQVTDMIGGMGPRR